MKRTAFEHVKPALIDKDSASSPRVGECAIIIPVPFFAVLILVLFLWWSLFCACLVCLLILLTSCFCISAAVTVFLCRWTLREGQQILLICYCLFFIHLFVYLCINSFIDVSICLSIYAIKWTCIKSFMLRVFIHSFYFSYLFSVCMCLFTYYLFIYAFMYSLINQFIYYLVSIFHQMIYGFVINLFIYQMMLFFLINTFFSLSF